MIRFSLIIDSFSTPLISPSHKLRHQHEEKKNELKTEQDGDILDYGAASFQGNELSPESDEVSWNTMITGYAQNGGLSEAQRLFEESPVQDVFTWTAMVSGYVQNSMLDEARRVFDGMPEKNSVSWNAIIAGYVQ
ncbi:hypothetical protein AAG906_012574 [Vitis piasezkii]